MLTCNAILAWQRDRDIEWQYIAPDQPMQNGFVESFNGYATSALTNTCSSTSKEVSEIIEAWRSDNNTNHPLTSLNGLTPTEGAKLEQTLPINEGSLGAGQPHNHFYRLAIQVEPGTVFTHGTATVLRVRLAT